MAKNIKYPPMVASRMMSWATTPQPIEVYPPDISIDYAFSSSPTWFSSFVPTGLDSMAIPEPTNGLYKCSSVACPRVGHENPSGYTLLQQEASTKVVLGNDVLDNDINFAPVTKLPNVTPAGASSTIVPSLPAPYQPVVSSLVAAYLIFVVTISVAANTVVVVVRVCGRRRRVRSSHVCTLCLAVSDIAFSILVHTLMILAALGVDPLLIFDTAGCNYYGFSAMFFGTFSMCIHASVSIIRYINICHPEKVEWLQLKYVYMLIVGSFIYSVAWAMGPLFHWGRYETFEFGCTLAFSDPSRSGRSFVTCAFIFVLLLPLGIVLTCYLLIVLQANKYQYEMKRISNKHLSSFERQKEEGSSALSRITSTRSTQRSLRLHYKLVRMSLVVAIGYALGWLPYAVVCMWATYGDYTQIPYELRIGASLFCKSATAYNPFIYYFMSEGFRADLRYLAKRAGFYTGHTASETTFHPSGRSSTRSSVKKSNRTRENSLNLITLDWKDSNSTCLNSGQLDMPSTPQSFLLSPESDEHLCLVSKRVSIASCSRRSSQCSHLSCSTSRYRDIYKKECPKRRISETPLSTSNLITDHETGFNYTPRRRLPSCDATPLRYQCRRSVSFSVSPTRSPVTKSSSRRTSSSLHHQDIALPHRSFSLYGFRDNKTRPPLKRLV